MGRVRSTRGCDEKCLQKCWMKNLKERYHSGDVYVDRMLLLKRVVLLQVGGIGLD
jgi:hypothetical protein